jgi:hypothetical protein
MEKLGARASQETGIHRGEVATHCQRAWRLLHNKFLTAKPSYGGVQRQKGTFPQIRKSPIPSTSTETKTRLVNKYPQTDAGVQLSKRVRNKDSDPPRIGNIFMMEAISKMGAVSMGGGGSTCSRWP